jgi:hypothetical protein
MSTAHTENDERALVGSVIATRYQITGVLGTGAMGTVYRAEQVDTRTPLAIKLLRKHLSAVKEADARFRREAFVGARIAHPNCVEVWDFGAAEDGSFYLAMEVLRGESLGDLLEREGPLPWRRALHIARHILRGLDHAHRESVVRCGAFAFHRVRDVETVHSLHPEIKHDHHRLKGPQHNQGSRPVVRNGDGVAGIGERLGDGVGEFFVIVNQGDARRSFSSGHHRTG